MELTSVADDSAVVHDGLDVRRYEDLEPDHLYEYDGFAFRTLARPGGELLCRFATVNDVHFGETECGIIEGLEMGPIFSVEDGEEPYPETMNRGAIHEIEQIDPAVVVVKGDLTSLGTREEYELFLEYYGEAFGDRLVHVRGNHDAYHGETFASDAPLAVELPGVTLAVLDTSRVRRANGYLSDESLVWLRDLAANTDGPVLVFGHHHVWSPESAQRPENYFGINPDDSERLVEIFAAHRNLRGYFAGHTHRNRVRRFGLTHDVPWVEVACVKDYPGAWAEYRVYEGGILQVFHRISTPEALVWTEKTRHMFNGTYAEYALGELTDRCFAITT
ncbi:metallophosphoesterase family protein [Rhabdothermincola sp.]|uniref:metallophosphoesterase family protein n=1 Tax=Rhabdothermincola sp. TaxID=2820405 RepID=UPI002FE410A3